MAWSDQKRAASSKAIVNTILKKVQGRLVLNSNFSAEFHWWYNPE